VDRPQLVRHLDEATGKLILVDAPAGYGKTTLLAQWRHKAEEERPFAWVSLDRGDNDPHRLWWHVACALQRACPGLDGENLVRPLQSQAAEIPGDFIPSMANELAALAAPVIIVLDDYHVIKEPTCHQQLESLLLYLPWPVVIVLSTRADPPLPLGRLRAAGDLTEIRMRELRFTPEEAAALIHAMAAVELGPYELTALVERTEGWPAGVYLAALSLREDRDPGRFVHRFSGSNRYVADFLTEEIINRQPLDVQQFLLHTSVLDRFTAPLCDVVAGTTGAQDIIGLLERENLFVVPLDQHRQWFRYHHLFGRVLLSRLARAEPDAVAVLHQRASDWHQQYGTPREAIDHALAAGNVTGAIGLIARNWQAYVDAGRVATVRSWLRSLGDDQISANPLAAHCAAWAAAFTGDRETVRRWLPVIAAGQYDGVLPDGMRSLQSSAALLIGTFGFAGLASTREAAAKAVQLDADNAGYFRIAPDTSEYVSRQLYFPDTAMLITRFMTEDGVGEVTDFMPVTGGQATDRHRLVRQLKTVRGVMKFVADVKPRFDYGRAAHKLDVTDDGFVFHSGGMELTLNPTGEREVSVGERDGWDVERLGDDLRVTATLREGETAGVVMESMGGRPRRIPPEELQQLIDDTTRFWRTWLHRSAYRGRWREMISRSAMTLKLMTYAPSGALVAAPTTGLPELAGGERNWDYRYTWVRDASLTMEALWVAALPRRGQQVLHLPR
jgi:Glycosyl hydrolases family 15/Domain of unknown function (DUF5911)